MTPQISFMTAKVTPKHNQRSMHTTKGQHPQQRKDEEMLATRNLEDDSVGHKVEYMEGEESTDFRGQD